MRMSIFVCDAQKTTETGAGEVRMRLGAHKKGRHCHAGQYVNIC